MFKRLFAPLWDALLNCLRRKPKSPGASKRAAPKNKKPTRKKDAPATPAPFAFSYKPDPAKAKAAPAKVPLQTQPDEEAQGPGDLPLDIKEPEVKNEKRRAFRVTIRGLDVACPELGGVYPTTDISATGLGFRFQGPRVKGGTILSLTLRGGGKALAQGLPAKAMRHESGVVGCAFLELTRTQEDAVYKIVLAAQRSSQPQQAKPGTKPAAAAPGKAPAKAPVKVPAKTPTTPARVATPTARPGTPNATPKPGGAPRR
ncbi:PilZ domain-containing protein [Desulfovibrio aminophilus]|uniref:PilZ domain-containing protein n=1 Tax=Desulfovibrio aminophilus TaxID=81425 RepID=UPI003393C2F3